jgi:xanthine dehydrogenase YagS FAD-binding subunit
VRLPKTWAGAKFYFEKVADRQTWDFALLSIAAAMIMEGDTIRSIRLVCGAVECVPRRLIDVEKAVTGQPKNEDVATRAGKMAAAGAKPLNFNHFKMPLMENLVRRAIRDA